MAHAEPAEVIDLVSSDDDDERRPVQSTVQVSFGDQNGEATSCTSKRRRLSASPTIHSMSSSGQRCCRQIQHASHRAATNRGSIWSNSPMATVPAKSWKIVLEDDGKDNAVITDGILEIVDKLNFSHVLTCTSMQQKRMSSQPRSGPPRRSTLLHVQQTDSWSCGFRNLQMMLTAMLPHLPSSHACFSILPRRSDCTSIPTVEQLQRALEQCWKDGFDPDGANHYKNSIVGRSGKLSHIGAVEVASVLSYWGVDATVVQFIKCSASRSLLASFVEAYFCKKLGHGGCPFCSTDSITSTMGAQELLQFAQATEDVGIEASCDCPILPLYLQAKGHSVTLVGIQVPAQSKQDTRFLVLDPMKDGQQLKNTISRQKTLDILTRPSKDFLSKDIQIIMCSMRSLAPSEKDHRRRRLSVVTAAKQAVLAKCNADPT